jgi:hypothetical protein
LRTLAQAELQFRTVRIPDMGNRSSALLVAQLRPEWTRDDESRAGQGRDHRVLGTRDMARLPADQTHRAHRLRWQRYEKLQPGHRYKWT